MSNQARQLEIPLPPIPSNRQRMEWRESILARANHAAKETGLEFVDHEKVEVVVVFFLRDPESDDSSWPDIDNLIKDAHDALQGALGLPGKSRDDRRVIRSDKQIYRVVAEKHHHLEDGAGGRLLIRPYCKQEWPLQ